MLPVDRRAAIVLPLLLAVGGCRAEPPASSAPLPRAMAPAELPSLAAPRVASSAAPGVSGAPVPEAGPAALAPAATDAVLAALAAPRGDLDLGVVPLDDGHGTPSAGSESGSTAPGVPAVGPLPPVPTAAAVPVQPDSFAELVIPDAETAAVAIAKARDAVPGAGAAEKWRHIPADRSGDPKASVSVGNATTGILVNGKPVPAQGDGFRVRGVTLSRGFHYGTDGLVAALTRAGGEVARKWPGSELLIGNCSREAGGDIPPSVSHNTGRDSDIGFYLADTLGRPLPPPGDDYVTFDADGVSEGRATPVFFDSPRNWAFVEALLTDPAVQIQYIFVADWLRTLLLDYAIRAGADPDLIVRADQVLQQPHNSSPHAEHFHVRLYCDMADRLAGCHDEGPVWAWVKRFDDVVQARIDALVDLYQTGDPEKRDYVRRQLDLLTVVPLSTPEAGENPDEL